MDTAPFDWDVFDKKAQQLADTDPVYVNAKSDPSTFLADERFHSSFICPRTKKRVTYADIGSTSGKPVLFFLQSHCSRWAAIPRDIVATASGIRLIAMDRPGCGGTEVCELHERVSTAYQMIQSLIEHLDLTDFALLAYCAGFIHLLEYLRTHAVELVTRRARVVLLSPWVRGNRLLPLIPNFLLDCEEPYCRLKFKVKDSIFDAKQSVKKRIRRTRELCRTAASRDEGGGKASAVIEQDWVKVFYSFEKGTPARVAWQWTMVEEQDLSPEFHLCIGKSLPVEHFGDETTGVTCTVGSKEWMEWCLREVERKVRESGKNAPTDVDGTDRKIAVFVWWGEDDWYMGKSERDYLRDLFRTDPISSVFKYNDWENWGDHYAPFGNLCYFSEALHVARTGVGPENPGDSGDDATSDEKTPGDTVPE
ncbi:hypothetical protein PUNSTDRAFT_130540 [Punctularia strigosozonata HHB-11173 SS5]|uniref:uncharacterized protein n=1 Tax=Punctularia strigosozonata (strain HHB-11173) TaxID=741275 RepID=UPI000441714D|nr:uncharacterized protein PUNSTDRAFT_130540 [Punctularia strigosozonata HHB-11173 SS5]EIN12280.1 hypothetical protein PUNSTDRAFT_130540 [Punctularia strigosozonata HHB-11173 SS5]